MQLQFLCLLTALCLSWGNPPVMERAASVTPSDSCFQLWIYGGNIHAKNTAVFLRTNPQYGEIWESVTGPSAVLHYADGTAGRRLLIISGLSLNRYFGGDIRENYVAVRVSASGDSCSIRAVYVMPDALLIEGRPPRDPLSLIEEEPDSVRRRSLAFLIRPRPQLLGAGDMYTEHIEAPVRRFKPGVREVEWLEILYRLR